MIIRHSLAACLAIVATASPSLAQAPTPDLVRPRSVTLALTEYNRLMDLADRSAGSSTAAPATAGSSAVVDVRVDGAVARGTVTVTGTAVRTGSTRVPLITATTGIDTPAGSTPVPLVADRDAIAAVVSGPGAFAVALDWRADVRVDAGRATLTLPAARTATARATVEVPGEPGDLRVTGGTVTARRRTAAGATVLDLTLVPSAAAGVSWIARDVTPVQPTGPARVVSDVGTVVTLTDTDIRVSALITLDVSRGRLPQCTLTLPAGYRVAGVHGATVERVEPTPEGLRVTLLTPEAPRHVLLADLERPWPGGATAVEAVTIGVVEAQRERGDLAVESSGTTVVSESTAVRADRVDVQEMGPAVRVLARWPLLAAYRYQRPVGAEGPRVALGIARFADAEVASAIVSAASATTLLTLDGRALTEVTLQVENERQPFVKVGLPAGSRIVSASLDGEPAKPVSGADGLRLPLLHAEGGRPARELQYVYLHDGAPFARKGDRSMQLPRMDLPIGVVHWEVFVPEELRARRLDGTAIDIDRFAAAHRAAPDMPWWTRGFAAPSGTAAAAAPRVRITSLPAAPDGQVRVRVTEAQGGAMPGVVISVDNGQYQAETVTNERGEAVVSGVPPGYVTVTAALAGFMTGTVGFDFDHQSVAVEIPLAIGQLSETITVTGESPKIDVSTSRTEPPPEHVLELQQRVAGVLPIQIDVPRAGQSLRFVTPLVVDAAPSLTLRYKRR